jgi:hypothetical protein
LGCHNIKEYSGRKSYSDICLQTDNGGAHERNFYSGDMGKGFGA